MDDPGPDLGPTRYQFIATRSILDVPTVAFRLIKRGGDDGTRTHDPLPASTPDLDGCGQRRTD
jgi:hypothetical protein